MRTVAEALDYAHRLGVLHLDLKPGNVLLDEHGEPHVADFGLARRLDAVLAEDDAEIAGTPSYMAPEQTELGEQRLGAATDIWGMGAVLYELVTGEPPVHGATLEDTIARVREAQVRRPRDLAPGVPLDLEAIVLRCLRREPRQRYPTARALADDLGRFLDGHAVSARPLGSWQRAWRWARREPRLAGTSALTVLILLIGAVSTALQWQRAESVSATARAHEWDAREEAISRAVDQGRGFEALPLLARNLSEQEQAGRSARAMLERRRLGLLLADSPTLVDRLVLDQSMIAAEPSPDGRLLAVATGTSEVRWYDSATMNERGRVSLKGRPTSDGQERKPALLQFTQEGRLLVTLAWHSSQVSPGGMDMLQIDLARSAVLEPPDTFADLADVVYSADGHFALLRNRRSETQLWEVDPWRALSAQVAISDEVAPLLLGRGATYAAMLGSGARTLSLYDPRTPTKVRRATLPPNAGLSAWAESRDQRWLALGDNDGQVFLLERATLAVKALLTPHGERTSWLSFSADGSWLAAANHDGSAYLFEVASGRSLDSGMRNEFELRRVEVDRERRLLLAVGPGVAAVWRLPEQGLVPSEPMRLSAVATHPVADSGRYGLGWAPSVGLITSSSLDGEVRLWRLPLSPLRASRAAAQAAEDLHFDGARLVDVAGARVRVVDALHETALTPWIDLPQAPDFVELAGETLVAICGRYLRVFDAIDANQRYPTIELEQSPMRLALSDDGAIAVVALGANSATGFEERLETFELGTGRRLAGPTALPGPLSEIRLSADGTKLMARRYAPPLLNVMASRTHELLARIDASRDPAIHPGRALATASFTPDGEELVASLVETGDTATRAAPAILDWDLRQDRRAGLRDPGQAVLQLVELRGRDEAWLGELGDRLVRADGASIILARPAPRTPGQRGPPVQSATAISHDGRLLARPYKRSVQLFDVESGAKVGAPLAADVFGEDAIAQLAFSPDGRWLLARTAYRRWVLWTVAGDPRPAPDLELLADGLGHRADAPPHADTPSGLERSFWRAQDHGPWQEPAPPPGAAAGTPSLAIAPRPPDAGEALLDLAAHYNVAPEGAVGPAAGWIGSLVAMPTGIQRFDGTDFDVRGAIQLRSPGRADEPVALPASVRGIVPPGIPVAAVRMLMAVSLHGSELEDVPYARVILHYADGSSAKLDLRCNRELPGSRSDARPLLGTLLRDPNTPLQPNEELIPLYVPRLTNPHPEQRVLSLDIEAGSAMLSEPVVFAVTLEPAAADSGETRTRAPRDRPQRR
jgi:WD40 repeat protein